MSPIPGISRHSRDATPPCAHRSGGSQAAPGGRPPCPQSHPSPSLVHIIAVEWAAIPPDHFRVLCMKRAEHRLHQPHEARYPGQPGSVSRQNQRKIAASAIRFPAMTTDKYSNAVDRGHPRVDDQATGESIFVSSASCAGHCRTLFVAMGCTPARRISTIVGRQSANLIGGNLGQASMFYRRMVKAEAGLKAEIATWLERAETTDAKEDEDQGEDWRGEEMPA